MRPRPFLSLKTASFRLGDRLIFENTSWVFYHGQQWAVCGPNGSGKSLLGDVLRGVLPIVHGELRYHFRPVRGLSAEETIGHVAFEERQHVLGGAVVQARWDSIEQDESISVRDFLDYDRVMDVNPYEITAIHDRLKPAFERRKNWAIRLLNIEPLLPRPLICLSNGEQQRVQITRALCHSLRMLILDEPFSGLDAEARGTFRRALDELLRSPLRVLLITSDPSHLPDAITHILFIENCRVVSAGSRQKAIASCCSFPQRRRRNHSPVLGRGLGTSAQKVLALKGRGTFTRELVRFRKVSVAYGETRIVHDLDWTVYEGESWALLGPNGSGKTTLLSLILGDHPQSYANDITVLGRRRGHGESTREFQRGIGWVSPELHEHFDLNIPCLGAVASGCWARDHGPQRLPTSVLRSARQLLRRFGLNAVVEAPLFSLSAGQQRLVLLARALVNRPKLLLLDEPCQGLDPQHTRQFTSIISGLLRKRAVTVIYITHQPEELPSEIPRVLRLPIGPHRRRSPI